MKKKILIPIISVVLLCTAGAAGYMKFGKHDEKKKAPEAESSPIGKIYYSEIDEEHTVFGDDNIIGHIDNELLVVANKKASFSDIEKLADAYDASITGWIEKTGDYQLRFNESYSEDELEELAEELASEKLISSASLNYISRVSDGAYDKDTNTIGNVNCGSQWENESWDENDPSGINWNIKMIHAPSAWEFLEQHSSEVKPVKIGLIDSGYDENHEDLQFAETIYNEKFMDDLSKSVSVSNHGTHVAGIMSARSDNKKGICGVYPYGKGMVYGVNKNISKKEDENYKYLESCMGYKCAFAELILRNVKVINFSQAFSPYQEYGRNQKSLTDPSNTAELEKFKKSVENKSGVLGDFFDRFLKNGYDFIIVSGAGNDSRRYDKNASFVLDGKFGFWTTAIERDAYPDVYDRILVVGAVNCTGEISSYSNGGHRTEIYAPGGEGNVCIYSTVPSASAPSNKYDSLPGTSMAAPHASGVAAMVWAMDPKLTGHQVKSIVMTTADKRSEGYFLLNAAAAVQKAGGAYGSSPSAEEKKGSAIFGFAYEKTADNKDGKPVSDVTVTAVDDSGKAYEAVTDNDGHFELIVPAGFYKLTVNDARFRAYEYPMSVSVAKQEITYLDEKLMLQPSDDLVGIIMSNEDTWIKHYDDYISYIKANYTGQEHQYIDSSESYCWFQDIDMNGTPEFIMMGQGYTNECGSPTHSIAIYSCSRLGNFSSINHAAPTMDRGNQLISSGYGSYVSAEKNKIGFGLLMQEPQYSSISSAELDSYFNYTLFKDKNGAYVYLSDYSNRAAADLSTIKNSLYKIDYRPNSVSRSELMFYYSDEYQGVRGGCYNGGGEFMPSFSYKGVTVPELVEWYDDFFEGLTPYRTTTQKIKISDYKKMSGSEKRAALEASYDAWSYEEDDSIEKPLEGLIDSLR